MHVLRACVRFIESYDLEFGTRMSLERRTFGSRWAHFSCKIKIKS